jgi:mediator of RNA polymerase II transcription subunit 28
MTLYFILFAQSCIDALTKEESSTGIERDEIKLEVDQTTLKFIDLARQTEAFFLQKRFLLSALKPEFLLKEENSELKLEITRKEELIRKHYDKIETWKSMLTDPQQQVRGNP